MKRTIFPTFILCLSLLLAGCSAGSISAASAQIGNTTGDSQYLLALQLAVGTLKLEGTEYPVSSEQAGSLLPLWKAALSLSKNDSASNLEMDALLDQIKGSMTSDQWKAIQSMGSSMEQFSTLAQEMGLQASSFGSPGALPPANSESAGQAPAGGGMPADGGAPPDAGGAMLDAGVPMSGGSSSQMSTIGSSAFMGLSEATLDAVIEFLTGKV